MAIDVAIALAVSWKPFVKSNETAAAMDELGSQGPRDFHLASGSE